MGEGTVFSVSIHTSMGGGGEGTPSQVWMGGVPCPSSRQGVSHPRSGQGGTPSCWWRLVPPSKIRVPRVPPVLDWMACPSYPGREGHPQSRTEWDTPLPPIRRQISIASTCYVADGVPLAFTQEGFLVGNMPWHFYDKQAYFKLQSLGEFVYTECHQDVIITLRHSDGPACTDFS